MDKPILEQFYANMQLIRRAEETLLDLFSKGKLHGTTHASIGQESIAAAVGACLNENDIVFASLRCHGHFLSCGGNLKLLLSEVMGRTGAPCEGRAPAPGPPPPTTFLNKAGGILSCRGE